jgi:hypothetical protein
MAFAFALPPREAGFVERVVFGCVAAILLVATASALRDASLGGGFAAAGPFLPASVERALLALPAAALLLSAALLMTGSLPRGRRGAVAASLGLFVLALVATPIPMRSLPYDWQGETTFRVMALFPLLLLVGALVPLAPRATRGWTWAGLALAALHEAIVWRSEDMMRAGDPLSAPWRVAYPLSLLAVFLPLAIAFLLAAMPRRARDTPPPDATA